MNQTLLAILIGSMLSGCTGVEIVGAGLGTAVLFDLASAKPVPQNQRTDAYYSKSIYVELSPTSNHYVQSAPNIDTSLGHSKSLTARPAYANRLAQVKLPPLSAASKSDSGSFPDEPQASVSLNQGIEAYENGDYPVSLAILREVCQGSRLNRDDQLKAYVYLAVVYLMMGEESQARNLFQQALRMNAGLYNRPWMSAFSREQIRRLQ
jgi:Flp pilus assembly protein TadD